MANTIQVKRSTGTSSPGSLNAGEIAWIDNGTGGANGKLFIGDANDGTVRHIGGRGTGAIGGGAASSLAADDLTAGDAAVGLSTTSGAITIDSNASTVTVDGHTGVTVQSSNSGDITLDSAADIVLDAAGGNFEFNDAGTAMLTIDADTTAGDIDINLMVDGDDLVFNQYDGTEVLRLADDLSATFAGAVDLGSNTLTSTGSLQVRTIDYSDGDLAMTIADGGAVTFDENTTMAGIVLDGNTITGVDDSGEFTDDDAHIMTSAGVNDRIGSIAAPTAGSSSIVTTGTLDSGAISSGFGAIDNGSSTFNTGAATVDSLSVSDGNITNVGDINCDSISVDAAAAGLNIDFSGANTGTSAITIADNLAEALVIQQGTNDYMQIVTTDGSEALKLGHSVSGTAITIGHSVSDTTIGDNLIVTGDLTVSGTTTTVAQIVGQVANAIVFEGASADAYETTLAVVAPTGDDNTVYLPDATGYTALLADATTTDGAVTQAEFALLDGGSTVGTTAVADGDGLLTNDGGTMKQTSVQTFQTYFDANSVGGSNIVTTGDLNSGAITSGFGAIDNGTSGIRTATFTAETAFVPDASDGATLGSATLEFSDLYLADGAEILFGDDQDVILRHVADTGLILKSAATGDGDKPTFTLQTGDTNIEGDDVLGSVNFQAPDEGTGTDAILVAAGIDAVSEGDFSSTSNATKLSFKTASSAAASETMSLSSAGLLTVADDVVIKSGGTIGGANDTDLLTLGNGALTVAGTITCNTSLTIGSAAMVEADLEKLDGITNGTAAAAKAVVLDSNKDIGTIRNLTMSGTLDGATIDGGTF